MKSLPSRLFAAVVAVALISPMASAQVLNPMTPLVNGAAVATGNPLPVSPSNTSAAPLYETPVVNGGPVTNANPLPVNASFAVTGFAPASVGTPISVTTGGVTGTLPAGTVVVASNAGATNTAYCALGASSTTAQQPIPPGGWFAFTVGAATQLTCITSTSTTTVNMVGGSGLPTGSGGGGGGGSGGAVTIASGGVASGAYASGAFAVGSGADGWFTTFGTKADAANIATGQTFMSAIRQVDADIVTLNTTAGNPLAGGSAIIGKVGIDQTTPGTTNGEAIVGVNATAALAGAGATGAGSLRLTAAQDTSTIAGSAPGTAGTPSANVLTAQPPTSNLVSGTTAAMTGTTSTVLVAAVTSNRIYVTSISCVNSHATVGTFVTVQDGSGGTALATLAAAAVFGGDEKNGGSFPLFKTTSGNALYVANVTTGANVICSASGFSGP